MIKGARKMERNRKWGESRVFTAFDATSLPSSLLIASQRHRIKQRVICRNWYCSVFPAFPLPFSISLPQTTYRTLTPLFLPHSAFFIPYFAFLESNCVCMRVRPTFAATGKVYNRSRLTERSNNVSAESCRIVRVRINDEKGTRLRYQRS